MAATACSTEPTDESASTFSGLGFYAGFKGSKGPVWKYFNFELDENGRPVDPNRVICLLCTPRKTVAYSKTPTNLKQHLQNKHPMEFADVVRSEEQKKNPKQSSIKDFTHCSPGSLALQYPKGRACELKKIAEMIAWVELRCGQRTAVKERNNIATLCQHSLYCRLL